MRRTHGARRGRARALRRQHRRPRSLVRVACGGLDCVGARARNAHDLLRLVHKWERAPSAAGLYARGASATRSACGVLRSTSAPPSLVNVTLALRAAAEHGALTLSRRRACVAMRRRPSRPGFTRCPLQSTAHARAAVVLGDASERASELRPFERPRRHRHAVLSCPEGATAQPLCLFLVRSDGHVVRARAAPVIARV